MTEQEALKWIAELFEEPPEKMTPETDRDEIPAWDSLGILTLVAGLDSDLGIQLSDGELQSVKNVRDILDILRRNGKLS